MQDLHNGIGAGFNLPANQPSTEGGQQRIETCSPRHRLSGSQRIEIRLPNVTSRSACPGQLALSWNNARLDRRPRGFQVAGCGFDSRIEDIRII